MGTVKSVNKLIFNSNFRFYFKILAINGTEKREVGPQLVIELVGGCLQLVQNNLKQDSSNAAVSMNQVSYYLATKRP